jgi:quercetin dioxygenase-like cupin family protein
MATPNTQRQPKRYVTGHNQSGRAVVSTVDDGHWRSIDNDIVRYNELWNTSTFPIDIRHDDALTKTKTVLSLSLANGTVLRMVDRSPGSYSAMHRTQSLDYAVVVEGEMQMILDSGEKVTLQQGDIVVQRQTMHQWHNPTNRWNRMLFVLMDAKPLEVAGKVYKGETGYEHVKDIGHRL